MGRSRGGLTTKLHALVDARRLPIRLKLTQGQAHDGRSAATCSTASVPVGGGGREADERSAVPVDFFYSKNRLNVAISRARTLALVLANPRLLETDAKSVEHLKLVNTLASLCAEAGDVMSDDLKR